MKKNKSQMLVEVISVLFVLLFIYAAVSKVRSPEIFIGQLGKSPVIAPFAKYMAFAVPAIEVGIAVLLMTRRRQLLGLYMAFTMMVIFTVYIIVILNFSPYIPCSCGGILEKMNWRQHLVFNCVFVLLGGIGVVNYQSRYQEIIAR